MFKYILKIKLLLCLLISFVSIAENEKEFYEVVSKDGQKEIYVREISSEPVLQKANTEFDEKIEDSYSFCSVPMQEPIKLVLMEQLNETCETISREDLKRIRGLTLDNVYLESIGPEDFAGLDNLVHLEFYNNRLQSIHPESFKNLGKLNHLSIHHNLIRSVDPFLFSSLVNLNHLNLSHNLLAELPEELLNNTLQLRHLNLSHNLLQAITVNMLSSLAYLQSLDLSYNKLTYTDPKAFITLTSLIDLDLSHNQLTELYLNSFQHLIRLNLSYNQLSAVMWPDFNKLIEVDVSYNQLDFIPWGIVNRWPALETFNYSGNALSIIEVNPARDAYETGTDQEWYDCWLRSCSNAYAYISVNKERYKFMRCRGHEPDSKCAQRARQWKEDLSAGHTLILNLEDKFVKSVARKSF